MKPHPCVACLCRNHTTSDETYGRMVKMQRFSQKAKQMMLALLLACVNEGNGSLNDFSKFEYADGAAMADTSALWQGSSLRTTSSNISITIGLAQHMRN